MRTEQTRPQLLLIFGDHFGLIDQPYISVFFITYNMEKTKHFLHEIHLNTIFLSTWKALLLS